MKRSILQTALLTTLAASLLCGQTSTTTTAPTPPTPAQIAADMVARLTTLLDLTSSQQTTATSIFTTQATTDQSIQTQMQTAHTALQTAITSNSGIAAAASTIGSLTTQQVTADATADAEFYAILTTAQQTKYSTLKLPGLGGPGGGRGGPGGPGGGPGRH
jgi:Spy/CpxP family protein refolding chaperone